jgi:hypothetical protein
MNKQMLVYLCKGYYLRVKRNELLIATPTTWIGLKIIIPSKRSQAKKEYILCDLT